MTPLLGSRVVLPGLLLLFSTISAMPVKAHVGLHDEIATVSDMIRQAPGNPQHYLLRGDLYRVHEIWVDALADFRYARLLDPGLAAVDLGVGRTYLDKGMYQAAVQMLGRFLDRQPTSVRGLIARAEAYQHLGEFIMAAVDYGTAIEQFYPPKNPLPEYYLARARAYTAAGDPFIDTALQGLDEGIQRLGNVASLQLYAIELERKQRRYAAALERLNQIIARSERQEAWLVQRAEILIEAGQTKQAIKDLDTALAAIIGLPPERRDTRWVQKLLVRIQANLESVGYFRPSPASK